MLHHSPYTREKACDLWRAGKSDAEICKELKVDMHALASWRRFGYLPRQRNHNGNGREAIPPAVQSSPEPKPTIATRLSELETRMVRVEGLLDGVREAVAAIWEIRRELGLAQSEGEAEG